MTNIIHTRNYLIGNISIKVLGFISIPFFTNSLTLEEFGLMSLYTTVLSFVSTLFSFGILGSFKRYYFEDKKTFGEFLYSNIILLLFIDTILMILYFYFLHDISLLFKISKEILLYVPFIAIFVTIVKIKLDFLQIREESLQNIIYEFIQVSGILFLSISFILILSEDKYMGKIYGDILGYGLMAIYMMYKLLSIMKYNFRLDYIKYALLFGLPVLPSMFSSFGLSFADRLMINNITNTADVGLYSFAFMIAMLIQVVIMAVGKSWQPIFYKSLNSKEYEILDNIFLINTKLVLSASLILILFSYELIVLLSNSSYLDSQEVVIFLIFGFNFFFLYTIYGQYTSYAKKTYIDSIITFISVGINIWLNYIFIPKYGYIASAITTIISYLLMFILFYINARFFLKFRVVDILKPKKIYIYYISSLILFFIIQNIFSFLYWEEFLLKIVLLIIFFYFTFNKEIKNSKFKRYLNG